MEPNTVKEAAAPLAIVLAVAASASLTLNIGKAIQKMKVEVLKKGKLVLSAPYRRDFLIWVVGISLTFVASLLTLTAQNLTDKTSLVSSMNGVGLIGLALFSLFVLKEKVGLREWSSVLMIAIGTATISYFNKAAGEKFFSLTATLWCVGIYAAASAVILLTTKALNRGRAFFYAAIAGVGLGLMNIFYHIGPVIAEGADQFKTPYPWIAFLILGNIGFVMTNLAFFHGTGIVIVPTVNSFLMISPMVMEVFIFRTVLGPMQYAGAGIIILGVILLTSSPSQASAAPPKAKAKPSAA